MKKILRIFFVSALFFYCPWMGWSAPVVDLENEIRIQEKARDDLNKKIQRYNEMAKKKSQEAQTLLGRLTSLQQNSKVAQQQIKLLELQSNKLQKSMAELNKEIAVTSLKVDELVRELRFRLVSMYKYGSREGLNLLLSAENTHEAVASAYLLERLSRYDQVVIDALLAKMEELEQGKRAMEKNNAQLSARTQELNLQRKKYSSSIDETNTILSGVQRERYKAEAAAKEIERAQQEIGRTILALMRKKKDREIKDREIEEVPNKAPGNSLGNNQVNSQFNNQGNNQGKNRVESSPVRNYPSLDRDSMLEWPVRGPIAAPYGSRVHPVFKTKSFNSGIDIRAVSGAAVKAAGPGEVLFEGWLRGFGQVIIVDHGRNISTVYAHLASTRVKERDAVEEGMVIGTVGNTGTSEGYNLHFEVRVGESAKNPLDYLKKT
ncbi:MAG: peptidoglycan DD-metalloendopeptidase family protein [Synergistaceae bacterium]|nr:peptidoglycan DD-metalloendopeptidase family protein [Synergistaceae bacterium]